jgi:hypothetical protein
MSAVFPNWFCIPFSRLARIWQHFSDWTVSAWPHRSIRAVLDLLVTRRDSAAASSWTIAWF